MRALILAGGRSSRLNCGPGHGTEKALITIGTRGNQNRLLDLVVESVRGSKVDAFSVAITRNTPKTAEYCKLANYTTVETPGGGYHEDLWYLLSSYPEFVSIACDLPFLRNEHINAIIDAYVSRNPRISVTGAIPLAKMPEGVTPSYTFEYEGEELVSCGINVVTNSKVSIPFIFDDPRLAINVNTLEDLNVVRSLVE